MLKGILFTAGEHVVQVNVELKGSTMITGTVRLTDLERAQVPEQPHGPPTAYYHPECLPQKCYMREISFCIV